MEREIKFRAWDTEAKEMHFDTMGGYPSEDMGPSEGEVFLGQQGFFSGFLMQYTGLKDKNGKEIYEGDILQWKNAEQKTKQHFYLSEEPVEFSKACFTPHGTKLYDWLSNENNCLTYRNYTELRGVGNDTIYYIHFDIEIVGNIYENPELLKH